MVAFHTGASVARRRAWSARTVLVIGVAATLVLGGAGIFFSDPVVRFMGAEGRLFDLTHAYLQVTWYLFGAYVFLHLISAVFQGVGDTRTPLRAMVWVNILHVVVAVPLIFGLMMYFMVHQVYMLLFCVMSPVMMVGQWVSENREGKRKNRDDAKSYKAALAEHHEELEAARHEGIELQTLVSPVKILAKDGRVSGVECVRNKLGEIDAGGRRRPTPVAGSEFSIPLDTLVTGMPVGQKGLSTVQIERMN
jgi:hypothetical protein